MEGSSLARQIKKRQPFEAPEEEAYLNLWRTFSQTDEGPSRLLRARGLCGTHYNILRILAGERAAGNEGLPVLEVRDRLISRLPDITRLIDKLEEMGLVTRLRTAADRRLVLLAITPAGLRLVEELKEPLLDLLQRQLGHLTQEELATLSGLLEKARTPPPQPES